jgi:RNA polymerase sigma-70 factor (ECF subfamily)
VAGLAYRFTGSHDDALDILQETFAYLLKKLPALRLSAAMTTFLYPVVRNLSINISRKRRRDAGSGDVPEELAAAESTDSSLAELNAVFRALPEARREVVLMRYVDEMSLGEIAAALEIPLGTVKSRLHNALETLRRDPRTREYFLG